MPRIARRPSLTALAMLVPAVLLCVVFVTYPVIESLRLSLGTQPVSLPEYWGGCRVIPDTIEFWEHRDNRLHDRLRYSKKNGGWRIERLAP